MNPPLKGTHRNIAYCVPFLQEAWKNLLATWDERHPELPKPFLVETYRPEIVQKAYYAQGRQDLATVNKLRVEAGLWKITAAENRTKITYQQHGGSKHGRWPSWAFDIGFVKAGSPGKMDYSMPLYEKAAHILREHDQRIVWGADWDKDWNIKEHKLLDAPHFEV